MNNFIHKEYRFFLEFIRSIPRFMVYITIITGIIFQNVKIISFGLIIFFSDILNFFLKNIIFRPLYKKFQDINGNIPIIGRGNRPINAKNCSTYILKDEINKLCTEFGMPSGHSQMAGLIGSCLLLYIFENYENSIYRNISIALILGLVMISLYHRYYENCHTIQQILIGFFIGIIIGYIVYYKLYKKYLHDL